MYGKEAIFNRNRMATSRHLRHFSLDDSFRGVSTIIHSAGFVSFNPKDAAKLKKVNIEGTGNVVKCGN